MGDEILLIYKRLLLVGVLIIVSLFILSFIFSALKTDSYRVRAATPASENKGMSDSPNVITSGMATLAGKVNRITGSVTRSINDGITSVGSAVTGSGKFIVRSVGSGLSSAGDVVSKGATLVSDIPDNIAGSIESVSDKDVVSAVIRPDGDAEVPIIDPNSPELRAALASLPPAREARAHSARGQNDSGPVWPMHGKVTTEFGVYHQPYQATHTGLDISDGKPAGSTPVKPFRPGKVIEVIHSYQGLGHHVIVDHGNGVTSVYAHLSSISVNVGQEVTLATVIGVVGSTGVSTGPHLHFEIRVNGQAADPRQFISDHL
ncbi:MAG TPA: M23 family metallopeptidase [Candidatus Saccharimonadales bacterium]|nr:M23 family metallopeptidase [Candidatus Saccharimonadales bacterium]